MFREILMVLVRAPCILMYVSRLKMLYSVMYTDYMWDPVLVHANVSLPVCLCVTVCVCVRVCPSFLLPEERLHV